MDSDAMTIKDFVALTGVATTTLNSRLNGIGASPVGVLRKSNPAFLWAMTDLKKAQSLIGVYERPRGRRKMV